METQKLKKGSMGTQMGTHVATVHYIAMIFSLTSLPWVPCLSTAHTPKTKEDIQVEHNLLLLAYS